MVTRKEVAGPLAITLYIALMAVISAIHPMYEIMLVPSGRPEPTAHLARPLGYVLIAPLSDVLDELTLLSVPQLIALVISVVIVYVIVRVAARRGRPVRAWCEFLYGLRAFLILVLAIVCVPTREVDVVLDVDLSAASRPTGHCHRRSQCPQQPARSFPILSQQLYPTPLQRRQTLKNVLQSLHQPKIACSAVA